MPRSDGAARRQRPALIACLLALGATAGAQAADEADKAKQLQQVERALEADRNRVESLRRQADTLSGEIAALQAEMIAAAAAAQDREEELSRLEARLALLEETAAEKGADFAHRQAQLTEALAALQRLSRQPPEALILGPDSPLDTVRSAMLLQVAVPALQEQAAMLRRELIALRRLGEEIERRREDLAATAAALAEENARIADLIERKRALQQSTAEAQAEVAERVAKLAREASDLRDLVAKLEAKQPQVALVVPPPRPEAVAPVEPPAPPETAAAFGLVPPENIRGFPARNASLTPPARGEIVTRFGEATDVGLNSKGVTIATRPGAQVVAPFDGQIVFRGPFRGYGEILIIEHRGGYHTLLVGLGRTDAAMGQWLLAGEPVGIMGPAGDGNPELYLELRHGGETIDPLPWLKARVSDTEVRE